jgi:hypothetical protein
VIAVGATSSTEPLCSRLSASKVAQEVAQEHTAMAAGVAVNAGVEPEEVAQRSPRHRGEAHVALCAHSSACNSMA